MDNIKKNDRRISIVLNGKEKSYEELKKDKQAYEELLNEEISATTEEEQSEDFLWVLPEKSPKVVDLGERRRDKNKPNIPFWDDGKSEKSPKLPHIKRKKKRKFDFRQLPLGLIGIIMSAVIVGVSFGFMMLTIFTGDKIEPQIATNPIQTAPAAVDAPTVAMNGEIPILGVEIVQGGAFTLHEKANETAVAMKENGFAAALSNTPDRVYLFIGIALDREQARVIGDHYETNGQDVYLKPYAVSANGVVETQEQSLYLQKGVALYQQLALLSVNIFANGGSLITEDALTELATLHAEFIAYNQPYSKDEQRHELAATFQTELSSAVEALQSYATTKSDTDRWQVQQNLLNGLIAYENLVKTY